MKSTLVRLGIRGFNPKLRLAANRMKDLRMPEGAPIPPNTLAELRREMARLRFVNDQLKEIEVTREERLAAAPDNKHHSMVRLLSQIHGLGLETTDMLVGEVFSRDSHRRALARYGGLTGSPDESGKRRREKGIARAGNARVRAAIQLAWRFLVFHKDSALARWYRERTADGRNSVRKTMIVALAGTQASDRLVAVRYGSGQSRIEPHYGFVANARVTVPTR